MKKTISFIVMAVLCLFYQAHAQVVRLSGRVSTRPDHKPLPGATVRIKESSAAAQTDSKGNFSLGSTLPNGTLLVSYTGYKTKEYSYHSTSGEFNFELEEDNSELNEVVVIGYGQTTRKLNTGSVSSITAKQIEQQPVTNMLSALSGRMPGVFVQTTNGLPGGNINIQIRGKGSIVAGTNPLYIIDGVHFDGNPVNKGILGDNTISGAISPLNNINPADVESVTVLKDADATSIYGSRGANGVVIIKTKSAAAGAARFEMNFQNGISKAASFPNLLSLEHYLNLRRTAFANAGQTPSAEPNDPNYAPDLTIHNQSAGTDWIRYIYGGTAGYTDLQASIMGGPERSSFKLSANYRKEGTVLPGKNDYQRGGYAAQFRYKSGDSKFDLAFNNQLNIQYSDLSNAFQGLGNINLAPNFPLIHPDGSYNWDAYANIAAAAEARSRTKTGSFISNLNTGFQFTDELLLSANAGYTRSMYNQALIFPERSLMPGTLNYSILGDNLVQSFIAEPQLDFHKKAGAHIFSFLAGATYQTRHMGSTLIQASNFKLESLMEDLGSAVTIDGRSSAYSLYKYVSVFGRLNYNLADTYLLNATLRRDGSSRFGPGNRFGNFASISGAWIFSNLEFFRKLADPISHGKLRISYGTTGNDQISDYQYLSTYSSPATSIYQDIPTIRPNRISNTDFKWETTRKLNAAMELGFLNDKLFFIGEYYQNNSIDQLVNYSLPQSTGFSSYQANLPATVRNSGMEFTANATIFDGEKFGWSANLNITFPRNVLRAFENFASSSYSKIYELGYDISRIYGVKSIGVNPLTGQMDYAGLDGAASANPYQFFTLGKLTPDWYGGFANQFKFGNFQLDIFAQFARQHARGGLNGNFGALPFNNFTAALNDNMPEPSLTYDGNLGNSDLNVFDTSYLRIKNIHFAYKLPRDLIRLLHLNGLKIYASGQNLYTLWNEDAAVYDPESGVAGNVPPMKTLVFGFQLSL